MARLIALVLVALVALLQLKYWVGRGGVCVTSARVGLAPAALAAQAHAGDVFVYRTGTCGLRESRARLPAT